MRNNYIKLSTSSSAGAQIAYTKSPGRLNFLRWRLVFVSPQYGTCLYHRYGALNLEPVRWFFEPLFTPDYHHHLVLTKCLSSLVSTLHFGAEWLINLTFVRDCSVFLCFVCVFIRVHVYFVLDSQLTIPTSTGKSIRENSTELNGTELSSPTPSNHPLQ